LNSIRQSSGLRWTKACLPYHTLRMQHSIELISNCMSFLTRHQKKQMNNKKFIFNNYKKFKNELWRAFKVVDEKQAVKRQLHILK
jgi:hypothetical protein